MLLFRSDPFRGTHELLPCGLLGGDLVKLFRKNKSKYYWYDFTVRGERYRGSTKETNETRAQKAASLKLAATIKGSDPLDRKPPTLREYAKDFLQWVATGRLESDTRRYYRNGWPPRTFSFRISVREGNRLSPSRWTRTAVPRKPRKWEPQMLTASMPM
jgi:hypothetical protein